MNEPGIDASDLQRHLRHMFGERTRLTCVTRVAEGMGKTTYVLETETPDQRCILHLFVVPGTRLTEVGTPHDPVFFPTGAAVFAANNRRLIETGVNVPPILAIDASRARYDFDFAFVEYIEGNTLADIEVKDAYQAAAPLLGQVHEQMLNMHALTRSFPGSVLTDSAPPVSCEDVVLDHSLQNLDLAAEYNSTIEESQVRIREVLAELHGEIGPRSSYHFVHGELGPEHIMIDRAGKVYFIDFEGAAYFDLEYEHSYLQWRFGEEYTRFARDDLDEARMDFYLFARLISVNATTSEGVAKSTEDTEWGRFFRDVSASTTRRILARTHA